MSDDGNLEGTYHIITFLGSDITYDGVVCNIGDPIDFGVVNPDDRYQYTFQVAGDNGIVSGIDLLITDKGTPGVPEPASLGLLGLGSGLLLLRRKRHA
ncbi:MAG: PEP-CTERM sorting domain-containing protein [Phycisphaerales bacterium]|nr:PEP-CTERM sorting domain-containing protein [Phycisphaerales bacterium]